MIAANFGFWSPSPVTVRGLKRASLEISAQAGVIGLVMKIIPSGHGHQMHPCREIPQELGAELTVEAMRFYPTPSVSVGDLAAVPRIEGDGRLGLYMFETCAFIAPHHEGPGGFAPHIWQTPGSSQHEKISKSGALRAALCIYEELHARAKKDLK